MSEQARLGGSFEVGERIDAMAGRLNETRTFGWWSKVKPLKLERIVPRAVPRINCQNLRLLVAGDGASFSVFHYFSFIYLYWLAPEIDGTVLSESNSIEVSENYE